jgi:hypothetical protein
MKDLLICNRFVSIFLEEKTSFVNIQPRERMLNCASTIPRVSLNIDGLAQFCGLVA